MGALRIVLACSVRCDDSQKQYQWDGVSRKRGSLFGFAVGPADAL
jgi:hypothetical protein